MSGPYVDEDGSVIASALSAEVPRDAKQDAYFNFRLEQGQIIRAYTVDDKANRSEKGTTGYTTLYDVRITKADGSTEIIPRCRAVGPVFGGGINNFLEVIPTDGAQAKDETKSEEQKRGHMVLIGFIGGAKEVPVILGSLPHLHKTAVGKRPKKSEGVVTKGEIQGLEFKVDNDGAMKVVFNGPRKDDGSNVNTNGPTTVEITKTGNVRISTNAAQSVEINRETGFITVTNGPTYLKMDKGGDKIQVVAKTVEVGTGGLQPAVVGDDWKKIMEDLIDAIMQQTHPTGVGPSGTPINSAAFSAVKSKLKEALSKNHKIEK